MSTVKLLKPGVSLSPLEAGLTTIADWVSMALNMRNPLVKRPIMMAGIEGGAIFILTLLAGESLGKILQLSLIAAAIAGVAGLAIGAFEKATVNPSKFQAPTKREKARAQKKKEEKKSEDKEAAIGSASTPADASKIKSWAERAIDTHDHRAPSEPAAPDKEDLPALPTVTTSAAMPSVSAPSQPMLPSTPAAVGVDQPSDTPATPEAPPTQPMTSEPAPGSIADDDQSQAAALLNQLIGSSGTSPGLPAQPVSPPPASQEAEAPQQQTAIGEVGLSAAIIHPEEELRAHIQEQLREAGFKISVLQEEFQSGLVALLENQPDLIVTAAPPLAEDYFQNVRRACQYGVIVLYGDEDPAGIDQVTGVWRPWTPLNVDALRSALGLP